MYFQGLIIAIATFFIIGLCHPIVIKSEYYFGVRCWPFFAAGGALTLAASLFVEDIFWAALLGVTGCSLLWSILEIFDQRDRVLKGWFPKNPKHPERYEGLKPREKHHCKHCK